MPGCSGELVVTTSCAFLFLHARLRVQRAPGIPCALSVEGGCWQSSGVFTPRDRGDMTDLAPSLRAERSNPSSIWRCRAMDCFAALAMTGNWLCRGCLKSNAFRYILYQQPPSGRANARPVTASTLASGRLDFGEAEIIGDQRRLRCDEGRKNRAQRDHV